MADNLVQHRIDELASELRRLARRSVWLRGSLYLIAAAVGFGLIDLLFPLPALARRVAAVAWLVAWLGVAVWGLTAALATRRRPAEFFAMLFERGGALAHNALVNAVQFSRIVHVEGSGASSSPLMRAAIAQGNDAAGHVATNECVDRHTVRRRGAALIGAVLLVAASSLLWPDVWAAIAPRFYDPDGDHPPFCRTRFAVRYESDKPDGLIAKGDSPKVIVGLSGAAIPDQAWLYVRPTGAAVLPSRVDLLRRSETQWSARVDDIRCDTDLRVHVPGGYSKWQHLRLAPVPRITAAVAGYSPPADTRREPYDRPIDKNGIREWRGSRVTVTLASDRLLRAGEIVLSGGADGERRLTMQPAQDSPMSVRGSFVLEHDGRLTAWVTGADGLRSRDRIEADVRVDEPPVVRTAPATGEPVTEEYKQLLADFARLAERVPELAAEGQKGEIELAARPADAPATDPLRGQLQTLAAEDRSFRRTAADLARRMDAAGQHPATTAPTSAPRSTNRPAGDGSAPDSSKDAFKILSDALRETAERQGSHELTEQIRREQSTNDQVRRPLQRMLEDLKKDTTSLCGSECQGACKRASESFAASTEAKSRSGSTGTGPGSAGSSDQRGSPVGSATASEGVADRSGDEQSREVTTGSTAQGQPGQSMPVQSSGVGGRPPDTVREDAITEPAATGRVEFIAPDEPVEIDAGPILGEQVPARYKELTEAYFRRLAEENR